MTEPWRTLFLAAAGAWVGIASLALLLPALLVRRLGRVHAWPTLRTLLPLLDLAGTWAGTAAAAALLLGRRGYGVAWALALGLVALVVAGGLYHRAALLTSLDAATRRTEAGGEQSRWEADRRFLWRMSGVLRALALAGAAGALAAGAAV